MYYLAIPKDRVGVLIGPNGETKKRIEKQTKTKIKVNKQGEVTIMGNESLDGMKARDIVKAIGRGFSPVRADFLLNDDYILYIVKLTGSPKQNERIKGRIIGKGGRMRNYMEEQLNCVVSVYGNTVAIIGHYKHLGAAREAIEMLISGSMHSTVYRYIERFLQERASNA